MKYVIATLMSLVSMFLVRETTIAPSAIMILDSVVLEETFGGDIENATCNLNLTCAAYKTTVGCTFCAGSGSAARCSRNAGTTCTESGSSVCGNTQKCSSAVRHTEDCTFVVDGCDWNVCSDQGTVCGDSDCN